MQFNLLNNADVDEYAQGFIGRVHLTHPHVTKWWLTTFVRWLKTQEEFMKVCEDQRVAKSPLLKVLSKVAPDAAVVAQNTTCFVDPASLPNWATKALNNYDLYWFNKVGLTGHEGLSNTFSHWVDYLMSEVPNRDIFMSVEDLKVAVEKWDARLARQKQKQELSIGTTVVARLKVGDESYDLVRLNDSKAYAAEGAAMSNCVAGYWGRKNTEIYSLRNFELSDRPAATIELVTNNVVQVKAPFNAKVEPAIEEAIKTWALSQSYTWFGPQKSGVELLTSIHALNRADNWGDLIVGGGRGGAGGSSINTAGGGAGGVLRAGDVLRARDPWDLFRNN